MVRFLLRLYLAECPTNQGNCDRDVTVSLRAARMPLADDPYGIPPIPTPPNKNIAISPKTIYTGKKICKRR